MLDAAARQHNTLIFISVKGCDAVSRKIIILVEILIYLDLRRPQCNHNTFSQVLFSHVSRSFKVHKLTGPMVARWKIYPLGKCVFLKN